jgi:acetylornithine deacetylase
MLAFVVGEEVNGDGMRAFGDFLAQTRPAAGFDAAIFGEPTENKLACGHKGGLFCSLTAKGVPGHSGYPWLGKSANEVTIRALAKLLDTNLGSSEQYGNTTVNIGRFDGGIAANVIPESAKVGIMVRVAIGPEKEGAAVVKERILDVLNEVDDEAFDLDCAQGYGFVGCDCDVDGEHRHRH